MQKSREKKALKRNCHFIFPPGWRGQLVEKILGRRFVTGPARSLRRLKRAAEQDPILA